MSAQDEAQQRVSETAAASAAVSRGPDGKPRQFMVEAVEIELIQPADPASAVYLLQFDPDRFRAAWGGEEKFLRRARGSELSFRPSPTGSAT
jgi:hypothetical protein